MGGAIEAVTGFDVGGIVEFAQELGSVVSDLGTEFLDASSFTSFEIPSFDISSFGGFDQIGSLAGNASWFDTFNPGAILNSIPSVSDFNISSFTDSLPSLSSIKDIASTVSNDIGSVVKTVQSGVATYQKIAPAVNVASSALGIQNPIDQFIQPLNQAIGVAGSAAGIAGSVATGATTVATTVDNLQTRARSIFSSDPNVPASASFLDTARARVSNLFTTDPASATGGDALRNVSVITTPTEIFTNEDAALFDRLAADPVRNAAINRSPTEIFTDEDAALFDRLAADPVRNAAINRSPTEIFTDEDAALFAQLANRADQNAAINTVTARQSALQNAGTNIQNLVAQARKQQELRNQRQDKAQSTDWRVRLRLAPNSNYLYNSNDPGLLAPLASSNGTDGVIFPYTPAIDTAYKANYDAYDLTHSNFRGYFYKNSSVDVVNIRAQFTAQDTNEADYLMAVIHFFRSVTKMFYGQDALRGSPPPLVYLSGYGVSQFNEHPCVVSQFNYSLPTDVDYIRAGTTLSNGTNLLPNRTRQPNPTNPLSYSINRLLNNGLTLGALATRPTEINGLGVDSVSYVPTKMEISIALLPIQSRSQVSKQFSLQGFSNGNLLRAGYW